MKVWVAENIDRLRFENSVENEDYEWFKVELIPDAFLPAEVVKNLGGSVRFFSFFFSFSFSFSSSFSIRFSFSTSSSFFFSPSFPPPNPPNAFSKSDERRLLDQKEKREIPLD